MSSSAMDDIRASRLLKFFHDLLHGKRSLNSSKDCKLFIEAVCAQPDSATCAHKLLSSSNGLTTIQASLRYDTSTSFLNEHAVLLLEYLQAPSLRGIESGTALARILVSIVEPAFFWDAFSKAYRRQVLSLPASRAFAWLLHQLVSLPGDSSTTYLIFAKSPDILNLLLNSSDGKTRIIGQNIKHLFSLESQGLHIDAGAKPGGRHDNDHEDHRKISIMPSADELLSKDVPFLRTAGFLDDSSLVSSLRAIHIDNQFRLLREDMLGEIREELQKLMGAKSGRHKGLVVDHLRMVDLDLGTERRSRRPWGVVVECTKDLPQLNGVEKSERKDYLVNNRHILRHGNMTCLLVDNEPVAFPTIHRDEERLSNIPAKIVVQFADGPTLPYTLSKMKTTANIKLVQLDTAVFAFEPFLKRLQEMNDLPLAKELLHWEDGSELERPSFEPTLATKVLRNSQGKDVRDVFRAARSIVLDNSQMMSLCASLTQRISLVQGPPGTGKSFIGALIAKFLHEYTKQNILIVCFTNHALDQFLEDLLDIGIPSSDMVRLGGKSTTRTKPLTIREQGRSSLNQTQWDRISKLEARLAKHGNRLGNAFKRYSDSTVIPSGHIMDYLEFASVTLPFFEAFSVPAEAESGMTRVGRDGKAIEPFYLLHRWIRGESNAGVFRNTLPKGASAVWRMPKDLRLAAYARWRAAVLHDVIEEIRGIGRAFNEDNAEIDHLLSQRDINIIKEKRIIACTTNGAAKFAAAIQSSSPGVVLVEEAGEILESHILTAMGPQTEQLILIGDHLQLRPKCSYELSVDGGNGYDLNRSLFERLVRKGVPHITLTKQHRMRPEISCLVRRMTYPDLTDADSTLNRDDLRGFRDNVMFINHSEPEVDLKDSREFRDGLSTSSKQNRFEAQMIMKCVRYLAQQGYGSDKMVVLTPYLGQLKLLKEQLSKENDPILNDLDKFDLVRAGLLTDRSSKTSKPSLRLSTVDNYQGEESDIVLASLTRSNKSHDIGFLAQKERLNVLLSRARNALILIGNSETFVHARNGSEVWRNFLDHLNENGHVYEGFPVKCEKHPEHTILLKTPEEFNLNCPDGGCKEPCGVMLKCGIHKCPSNCHQLIDHSKIKCMAVLKQQCANSHTQSWQCYSSAPLLCAKCERNRKEADKKARKALEHQQRRDAEDEKHRKESTKLQDEIERINQDMKDQKLSKEREAILAQLRSDLVAKQNSAKEAKKHADPQVAPISTSNQDLGSPTNPASVQTAATSSQPKKQIDNNRTLKDHINSCLDHSKSSAKTEWQRQKDQENANNPAIDMIMEMIGLEDVKSQVLKIKSKVDTSVRQRTDLKKERLGLVLLGNPGTGKTTIARHYAKILMSLQVVLGDGFVETTGSRLAHGGVAEAQKHLRSLEDVEGGVYFIDEAYQLAESHNHGGKTVLDFLLAEIENLVGKVVFVFSGYRKEMEKFFEHNPGLASRIPYTFHFEDYTDPELLRMLQYQMKVFYNPSAIRIEGGGNGLYMNIAIGRLGRGRGRDGFGNARVLENLFAKIRERQADRLTQERRDGLLPDDYIFTKEDLIGPDPSKAILKSKAWEQLQKLTGLKSVKESVQFMLDLIKTNYERELQEKPPIEVSLNKIFLGSPGTGKTTVAKLYGRILADIGLLSNGEVVTKNPSDFIGQYIGQSEAKTKAILATTVGKVLIIDEAYMLSTSSGGSGGHTDTFKTAVIDTIVAEIQSVPGEDRCVLLLGYEDKMVEMLQNVNPGLTRRFPLSTSFRFEDFNDIELQEILEFKLKTQSLAATKDAISTAIAYLSRARNGLNFGNGGDVENLISKAKGSYQARQSKLTAEERSVDFIFEPQDFDPDYDRASGAETNLQELFKDVVGCDSIVEKLDDYLKVAKGMRAQDMDPSKSIPMNFIFKGPPGTGKTTTARKFGQVFYDLGLLAEVKVVECSATDFIGEYVGQTGPKAIKQLERGLGKVLFIDEAYRLGEGRFAQEAVNELVDTMTKPKFVGKMVIILAGYDNDMNDLLRVNEGLSSRFADEIIFPSLSSDHCLRLLETMLLESKVVFPALRDPPVYQKFFSLIERLSRLPAWGNARDMQTLAKGMIREVFKLNLEKRDQLVLSQETAMACVQAMLAAKRGRNTVVSSSCLASTGQGQAQAPPRTASSASVHTSSASVNTTNPVQEPPVLTVPDAIEDVRDPNVSDAIWAQLQIDKQITERCAQEAIERLKAHEAKVRIAQETEKKQADAVVAAVSREKQARDEAERLELMRKRERARIEELEAKAALERIQRELERQRKAESERRRKEQQAQTKLKQMGVCCQGYQWIKQSGGYRCSAGGHYVSDIQLGFS